MDELKKTIEAARGKGMDDKAIKSLLVKGGWDADVADAALNGIYVPAPPAAGPVPKDAAMPTAPAEGTAAALAAPAATATSKSAPAAAPDVHHDARPKLSSLEASLHHVLLWFFTLSMTCTIIAVAETLFGSSASIDAVTTFLATTTVTLGTFGFFYLRFLRRLRREPTLTVNRVWSTITIVLHSIGAMAAIITLIAVAINSTGGSAPVLASALAIAVLDLLVVTVYANATFVDPANRSRRVVLRLFPLIAVIMLVAFMVASVTKIGPLRHDDRLKADLVTAARAVHDYTGNNHSLPTDASAVKLPAGVSYRRVSITSYELCGDFQAKGGDGSAYTYDQSDGYVEEYYFANGGKGHRCFKLESQIMTEQQNKYNVTNGGATIQGIKP